ncbi:thioesterase family protein [Nocardioides acrostichi]|uniref:Thioesterase family protein n=1 Tax=Nocardioides acrostichi TaxID=2784339 RepID=A0A930V587_9ACTN|nr:thioesterase family protein [Nocardioides acrostichi]MBF4163414.1 thioesterase family protein [Nocardioides acrostichi]
MTSPYFERLDDDRFVATELTGGAWDEAEQHIAPALGLLTHLVEVDRDRRRPDDAAALLPARVSCDILGVMPVGEVSTELEVLRPGRTIELVEARVLVAGRAAVRARVWLMQPGDTAAIAGTPVAALSGPDSCEPWDPTTVWPGGFIASIELRRDQEAPGRGRFWARTAHPLVAGEPVSPWARRLGILDVSNGMTVRADPREILFPNVDLTAHLVREPVGEWAGFDTDVTFGPTGLGLTHTVLHDTAGHLGSSSQLLTVRPVHR